MQRQVRREAEHRYEGLRQFEGDTGTAEILVLRLAVGAARIEDRVRGRELIAGQMVVGDDDINTRGTGGRDGRVRCYSTIAGDDQLRTDALGLCETCGPEVVAIADAMRHEGMHGPTGAAQDAREHRSGALAVHVVVAVDQDRPFLADRARQQLQRHGHIGEAMRVAEPLKIRAEEGFGGIG